MMGARDTKRWEEATLDERLRARGLRPTRARRLILAALEGPNNHASADELVQVLRGAGHRVGTATVYQNLNRLVGAGVLTRFSGVDGLARFDGNTAHHHHVVCVVCGRTDDVQIAREPTVLRRLESFFAETARSLDGWQIDQGQLQLRGTCPDCRNRRS